MEPVWYGPSALAEWQRESQQRTTAAASALCCWDQRRVEVSPPQAGQKVCIYPLFVVDASGPLQLSLNIPGLIKVVGDCGLQRVVLTTHRRLERVGDY